MTRSFRYRDICCVFIGAFLLSGAKPVQDPIDGFIAFDHRDYAKAWQSILPAAQRGNANAQFYLGVILLDGKGRAKDEAAAAGWLKAAAKQGNPEAMMSLATMMNNGQAGLPKDRGAIAAMVQKAAKLGCHRAMTAQYLWNKRGEFGYPVNPKESFRWAMKSVRAGMSEGYMPVAMAYHAGAGAPRDLREAYHWYLVAAVLGRNVEERRFAKTFLGSLKTHIDPLDLLALSDRADKTVRRAIARKNAREPRWTAGLP